MRKIVGASLILSLLSAVAMPIFAQKTEVVSAATTPTGYTKASDVKYVEGEYIANWGAREEDCVFLSKYATNFYTGSYSFDQMSLNAGGSSTSNAPSSALYEALQEMMEKPHGQSAKRTTYDGTKGMYAYTDCVSNNTSKVSTFYLGDMRNSNWDGSTYNREHTWPKSLGIVAGSKVNDTADIMTLRATDSSENSSRGNTPYGESSGYYDPDHNGEKVRGDCARMILYTYTRWGNTSKMWGSSGVMENLTVLLKWMEEDPVDTWEMGRNDAVQSITGTRNVFVDYPEYAWMLFGKSVPADMVTPSGQASGGVVLPDIPDSDDPVFTKPTTPAEILDAAYGLSSGETMEGGEYELTGEIVSMENWNSTYNDVNLTIVVNGDTDRPMYCYGVKGATKGQLSVGDTITVNGTIKNYKGTVEFDKPQLIEHIAAEIPDSSNSSEIPDSSETEDDGRPDVSVDDEEVCQHQFGRWFVIETATPDKAGIRTHICEICGYEEMKDFAWEEADSVSDSDLDSANDSDDAPVSISGSSLMAGCQAVIGLPMLSICILSAGVLLIKRKED